jgi:hypothetical protein
MSASAALPRPRMPGTLDLINALAPRRRVRIVAGQT